MYTIENLQYTYLINAIKESITINYYNDY